MASEMPVLPEVGSSTVQPGVSRPSASARSTMASAGRSLMEPVGLRSSSLAHSRTSGAGLRFGRPTSGVSPTACSSESYRTAVQPPATAGRIVTVDDSLTGASRPPEKRTSSSST